jgi:hypothetical protein
MDFSFQTGRAKFDLTAKTQRSLRNMFFPLPLRGRQGKSFYGQSGWRILNVDVFVLSGLSPESTKQKNLCGLSGSAVNLE